ncbi:MAG: hypothetical protein LBH46_03295 [Rickettsiales bacterium]|jgi:hemolysin activation/secretion protein|nr:hypothetical protein [Rickettsiales bacterium]
MKNIKKIKSATFILIFIIIFSKESLALSDTDLSIQQQKIIDNQWEQQRQFEKNHQQITESEKIRKKRVDEGFVNSLEDKKHTKNNEINKDVENCHKFSKIELIGNKKYSKKYIFKKLLYKYIGKCIDKNNIKALQSELTEFYIEKGYTTTRIYFDLDNSKISNTDLNNNIFVIIIEEGKIGNINLIEILPDEKTKIMKENQGELSFWQKYKSSRLLTQLFFAFPFKSNKNKIFNIKDFEQGLDQINKLQSNNATMELKPNTNSKIGYSDINIINDKHESERTTFLGIGIDNNGSENTGEIMGNINIIQDNLLALNDNIYLKYAQNVDGDGKLNDNGGYNNLEIGDNKNRRCSKSFYGNISIPLGYWTFTDSISYSEYLTTIAGYNSTFESRGNTLTQNYIIDRTMTRTQLYKINIGINFEVRDTESYIRDIKSEIGTRKSSNINIFMNGTIYTKFGTIIIKPSYQRGLAWFGSKKDENHLQMLKTEPKLQYDMLKLYFYYNRKINILFPINYTLTMDNQYSFDTLYGVNQFSVGGEYTTRGFKNSNISGDNGYYIRNDLGVNLQQLFSTTLLENLLIKTYLSVFYDYGYVKDKYADSSDEQYNSRSGNMTGTGLALNYYGKHFNWSLTYAKALHAPEYIQIRDHIKKENNSIYWKIETKW